MEAEFQARAREARDRGQTVFLSSHLLDEVEDICGRVAILRAGRLAEVADLTQLRRLSASVIEATVAGPLPQLAGLPGVAAVETQGDVVRVTVEGSPRAVLEALSRADVTRLRSREPTLEEIFVRYYETTQASREAVAAAHAR
jgi:ABC-2 type transport system ATP-binding protein